MSADAATPPSTTESLPPRDYRETLLLPQTAFPMKAGLAAKEPQILARWAQDGLYAALRRDSAGRTPFVLHDGPPYANGRLHVGHALNKVLKDIIVRSRQMMGFDADYVPGWDCHGLPIEWKVEELFRAEGRKKEDIAPAEFRARCRAYAAEWIDIQREEFKRMGVIGDWDHPYTTMAFSSEAAIVREFLKVATSGQLYRGAKPVMWSPVERTSLAEAEVEYAEKQSTAIWVKFPVFMEGDVRDVIGSSVVIWTTTPWTIPGNRAISYSPDIEYGLYEVEALDETGKFAPWAKVGEKLIIAKKLAEETFKSALVTRWKSLGDVDPDSLACHHPLRGRGYDFIVPLLAGDHVTDDAGTGFVHTAPGHGADDYAIYLRYKSECSLGDIPETVDAEGKLTAAAPGFEGLAILELEGKKQGKDGPANEAVIAALIEAGALLARGRITHQYPHSWRSKAPVIFRSTPQWFIGLDRPHADGKTLREKAIAAIEATEFHPAQGQNRLRAMVAERPDWLISRQRAWGVPLTLFTDKRTGEILRDEAVNARIVAAVEKGGADVWWTTDMAEFLGPERNAADYDRVVDILDVWFDSGSTHSFVLGSRPSLPWPADLYLEGSDQHRGWFQSSLLESCATRGRAPFNSVLTHGFTVDEQGRKMSKSLGNAVELSEFADRTGMEILRLWTASSDTTNDISLGKTVLETNGESYRKLRNTLRYLLGALDGFTAAERVAPAEMPLLERYVLHLVSRLDDEVRRCYSVYDFPRLTAELINFCVSDLSAFYFDVRKDSLYCDRPDSQRRRACRTVLDILFDRLTVWLAPILAFTTEEAWLSRYGEAASSVHLRQFPAAEPAWRDDDAAALMERLRRVRRVVNGAMENARREKRIGGGLDAAIRLYDEKGAYEADFTAAAAASSESDPDAFLADLFIASQVKRIVGAAPAGPSFAAPEEAAGLSVEVERAEGRKCARSWKVLPDIGRNPRYPDLSARDADSVAVWDSLHGR